MAIGCHSSDLPDHKEPPFSQSKVYHSEVKPHMKVGSNKALEGLYEVRMTAKTFKSEH